MIPLHASQEYNRRERRALPHPTHLQDFELIRHRSHKQLYTCTMSLSIRSSILLILQFFAAVRAAVPSPVKKSGCSIYNHGLACPRHQVTAADVQSALANAAKGADLTKCTGSTTGDQLQRRSGRRLSDLHRQLRRPRLLSDRERERHADLLQLQLGNCEGVQTQTRPKLCAQHDAWPVMTYMGAQGYPATGITAACMCTRPVDLWNIGHYSYAWLRSAISDHRRVLECL